MYEESDIELFTTFTPTFEKDSGAKISYIQWNNVEKDTRVMTDEERRYFNPSLGETPARDNTHRVRKYYVSSVPVGDWTISTGDEKKWFLNHYGDPEIRETYASAQDAMAAANRYEDQWQSQKQQEIQQEINQTPIDYIDY